jgi:hypothetical protein
MVGQKKIGLNRSETYELWVWNAAWELTSREQMVRNGRDRRGAPQFQAVRMHW